MTSRLIRGHEVSPLCLPWQAPEVSGPTLHGAGTLDDLAASRDKARRDGFEEGRRAGLQAAQQEIAARAAALETALDALARPFEGLEHRFHEEVLALVRALTRQVLRREMRLEPTHIVGVVREALAALPMSSGNVVVHMHPDDAATVRECLGADTPDRAWRIEPDPLMERGGCVASSGQSLADGRLDMRLDRAIATMFEDERRPQAAEHGEAPDSHSGN